MWFSVAGDSLPFPPSHEETFGNVWSHFWLSLLVGWLMMLVTNSNVCVVFSHINLFSDTS